MIAPILAGGIAGGHSPAQRQLACQDPPHRFIHSRHRQGSIGHSIAQGTDAGGLHIFTGGVGVIAAVANNQQVAPGQCRLHTALWCAVLVQNGVHLQAVTDDKPLVPQLPTQHALDDGRGHGAGRIGVIQRGEADMRYHHAGKVL